MAELNKLTLLKANLNMLNPPAERVAMLEQILEDRPAWDHAGGHAGGCAAPGGVCRMDV